MRDNVTSQFLLSTIILLLVKDTFCDYVKQTFVNSVANKRLVQDVMKSTIVYSENECHLTCIETHNCNAVNFRQLGNGNKLTECELLNTTYESIILLDEATEWKFAGIQFLAFTSLQNIYRSFE